MLVAAFCYVSETINLHTSQTPGSQKRTAEFETKQTDCILKTTLISHPADTAAVELKIADEKNTVTHVTVSIPFVTENTMDTTQSQIQHARLHLQWQHECVLAQKSQSSTSPVKHAPSDSAAGHHPDLKAAVK